MSLTHFDAEGRAHMVDVSDKPVTDRTAIAEAAIRMTAETLAHVTEHRVSKGDVLGVARLAGIMAAKRTADLIPLCHPLALTRVAAEFSLDAKMHRVTIEVTAETLGRTGVEMEALTAAAAGLLTIYDMCKAVDRGMVIEEIKLLEKAGGKSGHWKHDDK